MDCPETTTPALIDCRSGAAFAAGHPAGACSLPAAALFERMQELPRKSRPLTLCGTADDLAVARAFLEPRGYLIAATRLWSEAYREQLARAGRLETGANPVRLWQPAPLLEHFVTQLAPQHGLQPGQGLDLACGAGRDAVYLAQQGWRMSALDRSEDALQRVRLMAEQVGVTVQTLARDLEGTAAPLADFTPARLDLIVIFHYLHRPLFPLLPALLRPGGVLVCQTFMQGCEHSRIGRPRNPRFLLAPGELARQFAGFDIWLDREETLEDGRPVAAFVAAKPEGL
ncbi:MAG: methyltransferase domain-containing protein [Thiothrix sp.]|nr:methyltransferase domain-containing protein [Thiothrix sp.]HPE61733.1 methyltransferase domain-containing protein [Thiolinea sp.]